jgi:hypothetical protein
MSTPILASRRRPSRRRRGRPGSNLDWEVVGGAVIAVVALAAIVVLILLNADPGPDPVPMTTP